MSFTSNARRRRHITQSTSPASLAAAPAAKPRKSSLKPVETFDIGGVVVELRRVEARQVHDNSVSFSMLDDGISVQNPPRAPYPKEKNRLEVRVAGTLVGYANRKFGFGKQPYVCTGVWEGYIDGLGDGVLSPRQYENAMFELRDVAEAFVGYVKAKKALTREQLDRRAADRARAKRIADADSEARWAREAAERQKVKDALEARRLETLEGLQSIRDQLSGQLSNVHTEMLQRSIERLESEAPKPEKDIFDAD